MRGKIWENRKIIERDYRVMMKLYMRQRKCSIIDISQTNMKTITEVLFLSKIMPLKS